MSTSAATRQGQRLPEGGRIDRRRSVSFTVDGIDYQGHPGDTVASALLANGCIEVGPSIYRGRPRGIFSAGVEEPNALLQLGGDRSEPMVPATTRPLVEDLSASTLAGLGRLPPTPDPAAYDKAFVHTDVLVIGAGPAGLAAAIAAGRSGARAIILDEQSELGGSLLSGRRERIGDKPALSWVDDVIGELDAMPEVTLLPRTAAFGSYDDNYVLAVEHRTDHLDIAPKHMSRQRIWHIRAGQVIIATGAHERPIVFGGNDRPGVMLAGAVRTYLNRYAVAVGQRIVVATNNDSAYDLVADLIAAGIEVPVVLDARATSSDRAAAWSARRGVRVESGSVVVATDGERRVSSIEASRIGPDGQLVGERTSYDCDVVAVSGGWSPVVHLHSQRQGRLSWSDQIAGFVPLGSVRNQYVVGSAAAQFDLDACLAAGTHAGASAARRQGYEAPETVVRGAGGWRGSVRPVWLVPGAAGEPGDWTDHFVDLHRDQTVADVWRATGAGMRNVEHVKRYTSIGTGAEQGKTSSAVATGVIAAALGEPEIADIGIATSRAPYTPVAFAALAGS